MEVRDVRLPCKDAESAEKFAAYLREKPGFRRVEDRFVVVSISQELYLDMITEWALEHDLTRGIEMTLAAYDFVAGE